MLAGVQAGSAERWERDLQRPSMLLLGAWQGGRCVGVATSQVAVDDGDVHLVVVHPDHRRRGIGRALTTASCRALAALGARRVLLEVRAANTAAIGLYTALGFTEVARRRSYYRDGDDAVVLALETAGGPGVPTGYRSPR